MSGFDVTGAWDVHVHSAPSLFPRWGDGHELAAAAGEAGMGGVVMKAHHGSTVEAAAQLDRRLGTRVLGGLALNAFVGGLNPLAVERSVDLGAAIVWMPTIHARHHHRVLGCLGGFPFQDHPLRHTPTEGLSVLGDDGHLVEAAHQVIEVLSGTGVVLGTGHLAFPEIRALRDVIRDGDHDVPLLVNHALFTVPALDDDNIAALVGDGVWLELCFFSTRHGVPMERVAGVFARFPDARWVLATDSGQPTTPKAPASLATFGAALVELGVGEERVRHAMTAEVVALLGSAAT